jgi:hypothetical protein
MTSDEITNLVTALGHRMQVLRDADPADKAEVYSQLGLTLTYHPEDRRMEVEMRPDLGVYVEKCPRPDTHLTYMIDIALTTEFSLAGGAR